MRWPLGFLAVVVLAGSACQGTGRNSVNVWTKVESNTIKLSVKIPPDLTNITAVEYRVNGKVVGTASTGEGFPLDFDTTKAGNGVNGVYVVEAIGNPGQGDTVLLRTTMFIQNARPGGAAPAAYRRR